MTGTSLPVALAAAPPADAPASGHVRNMRRSDIPAVHSLFTRTFHRQADAADIDAYIAALFFDNPNYSEADGSIVYDDGNGAINSAILALPMPFSVHGRRLMGRLVCAFMSDGTAAGALGAARLARSLRTGRIDMCFTDNASPVSADHCLASGGVILQAESLEWRRVFRPLGAAALRIGSKAPPIIRQGLGGLCALADKLVLRWKPSLRPSPSPGCETRNATLATFLACAATMTERFAIRPIWSKEDFDWLTRIAGANRRLGTLQCRTVERKGRTIGAFLFFANPGGNATVLNLLCEEGREMDVVGQMFASLAQDGHVSSSGMAAPFFMNAIMRQRQLTFRHRGYFCIHSRHADLKSTAGAGDIYIGGLASESWSKLVTGF